MSEVSLQSDKMRNRSIGKLLMEMSLPAIFSMLVQSLYNIVDSLFVTNMTSNIFGQYNGTNLGGDSFNAVSIVFPLTTFVVAIAIGIGVGANAYIARKLGEGNREKANQAAKTSIVMAAVAWVVLVLLALTVAKPFVSFFVTDNCTDPAYVIQQSTWYIQIYMIGSIGLLVEIVCNRMLQATGNMRVPMISQLIGALTNIALDWLFISIFSWGVIGAIAATVVGQWCACTFTLINFFRSKQDVSISLKGFKPSSEYFKRILRAGLPAFVMNAVGAVITIIMNTMLKEYANGIQVLSAYFKVQSFVFMPVFGLMQGTMPILSYNYGANQKPRFNQTFKLALSIACGVMVFGTLLFQIFPEALMSIFKSKALSGNMTQADLDAYNALFIKEGAYAYRVISIAFIPAAFSILIINMLQSINRPTSSLFMSLSRQLLFLIPSAILFNHLWQQDGIWFAYPFAEVMSLIVYTPTAIKNYRKQFAYKENQYRTKQLGNHQVEVEQPQQ